MTTNDATRRSLHAIAELILAGPQYRQHHTIRLRITPTGFATTTGPERSVDGVHLTDGPRRWPIHGHTCADLARAVGVQLSPLDDVYHDTTGVGPDDILDVDATAAAWLTRCWNAGDEALRRLPGADPPVLWPEHFDVGIRVDDTNFGVSPGDSHIGEPYAYIGPSTPQHGPFWNQPFGAARPMRELDHAQPDTVHAYFTEGRRRLLSPSAT